MNDSYICPDYDYCKQKICPHSIAHAKAGDCGKLCIKSNRTNSDGVRCVEFPKAKSNAIISKATPKATRYHMRNK